MESSRCASCHSHQYSQSCRTAKGNYCLRCAEEALRESVDDMDLSDWSAELVIKTLRNAVPIRALLTIFWRYEEIKKKFPDPSHEQYKLFNQLLVQKLNFSSRNPLGEVVRQAAHEACLQEGKLLLPLILRLANSTRQIIPKVILTAGKLAPEDKIVQNMLEAAAQSTWAEIQEHLALALKDNNNPWAKNFYDRFWPKLSPFLKQRIGEKVARMQVSTQTEVPLNSDLAIKTLPDIHRETYQKILIEIENNYNFTKLKEFYARYLYQFIENPDFKKKYNLVPGKLRKADYIHGLAVIYSSKELFLQLHSLFPNKVKKIFEKVLWEHEPFNFSDAEDEFKVDLKKGQIPGQLELHPDFLVFQVKTEYDYTFYALASTINYLFLTDAIKLQFKSYFPLPAAAIILPLDKPEDSEFIHEDQARILEQISVYTYYLKQNYLEYTNNRRVIKDSLKQMAKHCQITEFFVGTKGDLAFLKTNLIIEFLKGFPFKEHKEPLKTLKDGFHTFFHEPESKFFKIPSIFHFIRRLATYNDLFNLEYKPNGPREFLKLFQEIPIQKWISVKNIISNFYCKGIFYSREDYFSVHNCYQKFIFSSFGYKQQDKYPTFNSEIYYEFYIMPFFKTVMFLLGTFGIVDLAYQLPNNEKYQRGKDPFLSPFDGLKYIRLTELGAFIIGLKSDFQATTPAEKTFKITLDEKNLLIFLEGEDHIKRIVLEKVGEKINTNCYRINSKSFLHDCRTKEDIQKKIALFTQHISKKPAPNWQEFFQQIEEKINPLKYRADLLVFQINPNSELLQLFVKDEVLKECILKAEDYNILIEQKNLNKIKKRLEEFGYFIDPMQIHFPSKDFY
jgi:hypothetical protein